MWKVNLRWSKPIEGKQKQNEPENGIHRFDRELCCCEEKREQRHMTRHSQWSECAKVSAIMKGNQTKGNDDKQNGLLMNVPPEEKGSIATKSDRADKDLPGWLVEEANKDGLDCVSFGMPDGFGR